jgi:thiosulfate sulfurtransferase
MGPFDVPLESRNRANRFRKTERSETSGLWTFFGMSNYERIDAHTALALLEDGAALFDIRDPETFAQAHHPKARHLHNGNLEAELSGLDKTSPILVCCYHGHSSQPAAGYLGSLGFVRACSIDGGWDALEEALQAQD